jgi:hypothetical protein
VCALHASLPGLAELHVAGNGIASLDAEGACRGGEQPEGDLQASAAAALGGHGRADGEAEGGAPPPLQALQSLEVRAGLSGGQRVVSWGERALQVARMTRVPNRHLQLRQDTWKHECHFQAWSGDVSCC